jgi:hypothetical protein
MDPLTQVGIAIGMEIVKAAIIERNARLMAVQAGLTPEQTDQAFQKARAEVAALPSATTLPEV